MMPPTPPLLLDNSIDNPAEAPQQHSRSPIDLNMRTDELRREGSEEGGRGEREEKRLGKEREERRTNSKGVLHGAEDELGGPVEARADVRHVGLPSNKHLGAAVRQRVMGSAGEAQRYRGTEAQG